MADEPEEAELGTLIYTASDGVRFYRREGAVFSYHPKTKELVSLCLVDEWPNTIARLTEKEATKDG
jgi:hypothetical protein